MSKIDLSGYNLAELKGLQFDIEKQIKERQQGDVKQAREQILKIAQDLGVSVDELLAGSAGKSGKSGKAKGGSGAKVAAQYQNPADNSQTWTGRGRKPQWVSNTLENGGTLEDLKIAK
jgi:DNA-binding protein H-NS